MLSFHLKINLISIIKQNKLITNAQIYSIQKDDQKSRLIGTNSNTDSLMSWQIAQVIKFILECKVQDRGQRLKTQNSQFPNAPTAQIEWISWNFADLRGNARDRTVQRSACSRVCVCCLHSLLSLLHSNVCTASPHNSAQFHGIRSVSAL